MTDIQIKYWDLQEGKRHNVATEGENVRHNKATEDIQNRSLLETTRHNVATETETNRHNVRTEGQQDAIILENQRHNMVNESIQRTANAIAQQQADTARANVNSQITQRYHQNKKLNAETVKLMIDNAINRGTINSQKQKILADATKSITQAQYEELNQVLAQVESGTRSAKNVTDVLSNILGSSGLAEMLLPIILGG